MSEGLLVLIPLLFGLVIIPAVCVPMTRMAAEGALDRNGPGGTAAREAAAPPVDDQAWLPDAQDGPRARR